jgi:hypothetical protein
MTGEETPLYLTPEPVEVDGKRFLEAPDLFRLTQTQAKRESHLRRFCSLEKIAPLCLYCHSTKQMRFSG